MLAVGVRVSSAVGIGVGVMMMLARSANEAQPERKIDKTRI
jgi:hypothetical protein